MNLGDVADFLSGGTPKKDNPTYWNGNIPWFSASNMEQRFLRHSSMTISEEGLRAGSRIAPMGSTLLLVRGSGLFNYIPICLAEREVAFNQDVKAICPKAGVDPIFLHYWIEKLRPDLEEMLDVTGIGAGKFDTDQLKRLPFPDYNLTLQKRLGQIVESFDRKIELNRRMNETLEALAQAIFKDWFVDFGPTRRKAMGETNPVAILGNLIPNPEKAQKTAALFPNSFGDDGLPEGWARKRTEEIALKIAMGPFGSNIKVETFMASGVPIISGHHLHETLMTQGDYKFITEVHAARLANSMVFSGDIIFTHAGTIGQVAMIPKNSDHEKYIISQRQFYLRPNPEVSSAYFLLLYFKSREGQHALLANASPVGVPSIARPSSHLKNIQINTPPNGVMCEFELFAALLFDRVAMNREENRTLAETRDYLLPKLMSGEVRVRDAEKIAEDRVVQKAASTTSASVFGSDLFGAPTLTPEQEIERDAVLVASVVKFSYAANDNFVVGNVEFQKDVYLIKRFAGLSISTFAKEAAGPYDAALSHEGGKPEAMSKKWIIASNSATKGGKLYEGSAPGAKIAEIDPLIDQYGLKDAVAWAKQNLASKSTEELECLATVDFAMLTLRKKSIIPTLDLIKADIATDPVWKPKLNKPHFSNDAIRKAMVDLDGWFSEGQSS